MKIARVAVLGVALGAGAIAAVLALNLTPAEQAPDVVMVEPDPGVQVLVAARDIPLGSTLLSDSVKWQEWPDSGISDQFIVRNSSFDLDEQLGGALARATFYAGEPIVQAKLITAERGFMTWLLPEGKRAVATRISAETSAGGFILPNDRVDVIMAYANENTEATRGASPYLTETILHNIRILAIDQTIEEKDGERVVVGQTATLELSPQQAEILTVAQQMAQRMTLALRSIEDSMTSPTDSSFDAVHLIGGTKRDGAVTLIKNGVARQVNGLR